MDNLEQKLKQIELLEKNQCQVIQSEILETLYQFRTELYNDFQNTTEGSSTDKDEQIKQLKQENAKLKYRIGHLVKNLSEKLENKELKEAQQKITKLEYRIQHLCNNLKEKIN